MKKTRPKEIKQTVTRLMKSPKRSLANLVLRQGATLAAQAIELRDLRAGKAQNDANASRLSFLLARHSMLEEWAQSARRVVFSFPGVTNE